MSSEDFFFSLIRISCVQILRAAGIDRCAPSTLDTMADLMIRHLDLLATRASKLAHLSGRQQVVVQDMSVAMEQVGLIKPYLVLDELDLDPMSVQGFEEFVEWAKGPVPQEARRIFRIPSLQSGGHTATSNAAAAAAVSSAANAATAGNNSEMEKKQQQQQQQQAEQENKETETEWLTGLMKKQAKVGHEGKFKATVLGDDVNVQNDTKIAGGPHHI